MSRHRRPLALLSLFAVILLASACVLPPPHLGYATDVTGVGQGDGTAHAPATDPTEVSAAWTVVRCATCQRAQVDVEMRRSLRSDGAAGTHLFARVRNRNAEPVAFVLAVIVHQDADAEANVIEAHPLQLGGAGGVDAERVVMLRAAAVRGVSVDQVERF